MSPPFFYIFHMIFVSTFPHMEVAPPVIASPSACRFAHDVAEAQPQAGAEIRTAPTALSLASKASSIIK